jgi:hypothetical protein
LERSGTPPKIIDDDMIGGVNIDIDLHETERVYFTIQIISEII